MIHLIDKTNIDDVHYNYLVNLVNQLTNDLKIVLRLFSY